MPFLVENGSGILNANSYASVDYADRYFADRNITAWENVFDKQACLIRATDHIDSFEYRMKGQALYDTNSGYLAFPRINIGFDNIIPDKILKATIEYALRASQKDLNPDPIPGQDANISYVRKKLGPLEKETHYATGGQAKLLPAIPAYPVADALLRPFLRLPGSLVRA